MHDIIKKFKPNMDYLKSLDTMSINPSLYVEQNKRFKNSLGGFMTIMVFLFILIISSLSFIDLIKRNNMRMIVNEEIIKSPNYNITHLPILFELYNELGESYNNTNRLVRVQANRISVSKNLKNDIRQNDIYSSHIDIRSCSDVLFFNNRSRNNLYNLFEDSSMSNQTNCLDLSDETIIEGIINEDLSQKFLTISLYRCVNSSANNNNCLSNDVINKILDKSQFVLRMPNFYFDNNDNANPGNAYIKRDIINLNSYSLKVFNYYFKQILYNTDNGLFFTKTKSNLYFKQGLLKNENYLATEEDDLSILKIIISMSNDKTTYFRSYDKFQNFLASVMAVSQSIIFVFKFFLNLFVDNYYFNMISNHINLFQKFEIDLLNRNIIMKKIKKNCHNIEVKSGNLFNENSMNKMELINRDNNNILLKNDPQETKNVYIKKINKFRIRSNKLNDVELGKNPKNNKNRRKRHSIMKNVETNNNTNLNNLGDIMNININREKNTQNKISIKEEKSFEIQNKLKIDNFKSSPSNLNLNNISVANCPNVNITNFALLSKNLNYSGSRIFKKPSTKLNVFYLDLFKKYFCNWKTNRLKALNLGIDYIKKKLSIEELLRKILEIDKIKFLNIDKDYLESFSNIAGPNVFFDSEGKVFNLDNYIYNRNMIFDNDYIDEMWNRFEFKENFITLKKVNNLFRLAEI